MAKIYFNGDGEDILIEDLQPSPIDDHGTGGVNTSLY